MNTPTSLDSIAPISRRRFLKHSSLAAAGAAALGQAPFAVTTHAAPDDPIRIGLIGCGGRGTGAVADALGAATDVNYPQAGYHTENIKANASTSSKNVKVIALADVFPDRLSACREQLSKLGMNISSEMCFVGFDAYQKLLAIPEVNYVILATPPHFRHIHLKAAIEAGKNAFIEKPVAVDGPGVRVVLEAGELARTKNLGIVAGTQRRHMRSYNETIKRLQDGAIGDLVCGRAYWNGGVIWVVERQAGWSDMEWQLRNWNYFTWLGGDHIVEQHVHNLDIMNWVFNAHPIKALALGGRQARPNQSYGHIYDHFAVEFEYPNGARMFSQCRQMNGCEGKVEEAMVGTKGTSNCKDWIRGSDKQLAYRFREQDVNPYQQEHQDLIDSIRRGQPLNEAKAVAESTLTGIMGRESAYSGRTITWEEAIASQVRLGPDKYEMGNLPFPEVATPGQYKFT
ncbi:MAG TPA: Gfo/Idh/MocA family oxidoreductase [Candidatus Limnocylindrales bacterium]|jgi:predicted dehydrogenase|nr:Gfo/Idh/MocA family oxidoreductase [Candidatus Limnocylindrales bacterium]